MSSLRPSAIKQHKLKPRIRETFGPGSTATKNLCASNWKFATICPTGVFQYIYHDFLCGATETFNLVYLGEKQCKKLTDLLDKHRNFVNGSGIKVLYVRL